MRVALVSPYSWTTPGGVNAHITGLAHELRLRGHEVRIIAPADGPVEAGVVDVGRTIGVPFNGSIARITFGPRVASRVRVALRRTKPELVHVHEPFSPSVSLLATMLARAPVVATFHAAIDSTIYRVAGVPLRPLWHKLAAKIAVSASARTSLERVFRPGAVVIPNGVDVARLAAVPPVDPATNTVLFVGRLEERKGPHVLAQAIPEVLRARPETRFVFAGDGPARGALEAALPETCARAVTFTGRFDEDDRLALLSSASIVCLPATRGESFGYTLVEAMAAGRPVVASDIPGYAAIARDGVEGALVPVADSAALAAALTGLLSDPNRIRSAGSAARERAQRYGWPVVADEIEGLYGDVLSA